MHLYLNHYFTMKSYARFEIERGIELSELKQWMDGWTKTKVERRDLNAKCTALTQLLLR